jgi:hypothetical protein
MKLRWGLTEGDATKRKFGNLGCCILRKDDVRMYDGQNLFSEKANTYL